MKAKVEKSGELLVRLSPSDGALYAQLMERVYAVDPLRYAKKKWDEKQHPRVKKPSGHAGEFAPKEVAAVKVDKKEIEKHPYHSMTSFPTFADTPEKQKKLEQHAAKELKTWRELATARVDMSITQRQAHNKILDPAFKALKTAFLKAELTPKWDVSVKRKKADNPEIEIPKLAKRKLAPVKEKIKVNKVSVKAVKKTVKAETVKRKKKAY